MIFVTVGTHEQQFDRLVKKMDEIKRRGSVKDEVVIQTGYSSYHPESCTWRQWFDYDEMCEYVRNARIVITHGGPASFLLPVQMGKVPVVVPRQKKYAEHVNDHQLEFVRAVRSMGAGIIVAEEMDELDRILADYDGCVRQGHRSAFGSSNNLRFNRQLELLTEDMFGSGHAR